MARSPGESGGVSGGTGFAIGSGTWPGISKLVECPKSDMASV